MFALLNESVCATEIRANAIAHFLRVEIFDAIVSQHCQRRIAHVIFVA